MVDGLVTGKRRGQAIAVAVVVLRTSSVVAADRVDAPQLEVQWEGPEDCPVADFTDAIGHLLADSAVDTALRVEARVEVGPGGYVLRTTFDAGAGRGGTRAFEASSCRTVTQAAALALAIAVDPNVLDRLVAPEPEPDSQPEPEPPVADEPFLPEAPDPPSEPVAPAPEPGPQPSPSQFRTADHELAAPRWRPFLGIAGLIDAGAIPGPGGGLTGTLGAFRRGLRGELTGSYRFDTRSAAANEPAVGGRFAAWTLGIRACGVPRAGAVEFPLCVGMDAGQTIARATGLDQSQPHRQPWLAGVVAGGLAWPVRPWLALTARASLAVPVLRYDFVVDGAGTVHTMGAVQGRGLLGLEARLP